MSIALVILAGGKGKRMQAETGNSLPKVLQPLDGKPLIRHLLDGLKDIDAHVAWPPVIVIGHGGEQVQQELGPAYTYVWQKEQLGTGNALLQTRQVLEGGNAEHVLVLYGDHPLVPVSVVNTVAATHLAHDNAVTFTTTTVPNFEDWRAPLMSYGRVVRDAEGNPERIVEYKDATLEERAILEVNVGYHCFRASWLWPHLLQLQNNNAQQEYLLVDMVGMAIRGGERVEAVSIDPKAALGVNTLSDLKRVEEIITGSE